MNGYNPISYCVRKLFPVCAALALACSPVADQVKNLMPKQAQKYFGTEPVYAAAVIENQPGNDYDSLQASSVPTDTTTIDVSVMPLNEQQGIDSIVGPVEGTSCSVEEAGQNDEGLIIYSLVGPDGEDLTYFYNDPGVVDSLVNGEFYAQCQIQDTEFNAAQGLLIGVLGLGAVFWGISQVRRRGITFSLPRGLIGGIPGNDNTQRAPNGSTSAQGRSQVSPSKRPNID
ncbi:hypothetical protein JXB41_05545 [Candidatus Woesearchaeota archaeon]|nr:hypothetical protein [Candidatus Woesearchaeota archaeon]